MRQDVAAVVVGRGEGCGQVGGRAQEAWVAAADGGPHGEERGEGGRDPVAGPGGLRARLSNDVGSLGDYLPPHVADMARKVTGVLEEPQPAPA